MTYILRITKNNKSTDKTYSSEAAANLAAAKANDKADTNAFVFVKE